MKKLPITKTQGITSRYAKQPTLTVKQKPSPTSTKVCIIESWLSEGLGWAIDGVSNDYINVANYKPLKGSSYIELPTEFRNSAKGLVNLKNKDNECFRWCHIRHLNPQNVHPQRIKRDDKKYIEKLDYTNIEFPVSQKNA